MTNPTEIKIKKTCENCKYWKKDENSAGECRRYPRTQPGFPEKAHYYGEWIIVNPSFPFADNNDWCGEFKLRPKCPKPATSAKNND